MKIGYRLITVALTSLLLTGCAERREARRNACLNNLLSINASTQQYMHENKTEKVPEFDQIKSMWPTMEIPTCPAGGIYTQAKTPLDHPTCSLGESHGHRLERTSGASTSE